MGRRSTKFYRKNEEEVMKSIGLMPTKNSGAGWLEKEDGQNDYLICQLKSTDSKSIPVKLQDLHTLEYNAGVSKKLPVFAVQFLSTNEVWLMVKPEDLTEVARYIETGECTVNDSIQIGEDREETKVRNRVVKSSEEARRSFHMARENKFSKEKKAW